MNPVAMVTSVTAGYEGFRYVETNGEVGVDPTSLSGPRAPTDLTGGLFGWPDMPFQGKSTSRWAFRNPGGASASFRLTGVVLAELEEECNRRDDNCDGVVDEGAGCFASGAACSGHADCESGTCTPAGVCGPSTCSDLLENGTESDTDCGGACAPCANGRSCGGHDDCSSGACNNGTCAQYRNPLMGEVVISEFMASPSGDQLGEWIELVNTTYDTLDLGACVVRDAASTSFVFPGGTSIGPGEYVLLGRSANVAENLGLPAPDFVYTTPVLNNGGDTIELLCGATSIDVVVYGSAGVRTQYSSSLHSGATSALGNNVDENFCHVQGTYATGMHGTPGSPNPTCNVTITNCTLDRPALQEVTAQGAGQWYTRVFANGHTTLTTGIDANGRIRAQVGYGPTGTTPATHPAQWAWFTGVPVAGWIDTAAVGRDEYVTSLIAPNAQGTSRAVASRVSGDAGGSWTTCSGASQLDIIAPVLSPTEPGDLLITEIMVDPGNVQTGEYIELYNATLNPLDLYNCVVSDNSASITISSTQIVPPGGYFVITNSSDTGANFGLTSFDYVHANVLQLGNSGDVLSIACAGSTIDAFTYSGSSFAPDGIAAQLDPSKYDAAGNDATGNWCPSRTITTYGTGNRGTPGAAGPPCYPVDSCRLQSPTELLSVASGGTSQVTGRVSIPDLTNLGTTNLARSLVVAQVGRGPDGSNPAAAPGDWTWYSATTDSSYAGTEPAYDQYVGTLTHPTGNGTRTDYAYRFSGDGGTTWTYCDGGSGTTDGYAAADAGDLLLAEVVEVANCGIVADPAGSAFGRTASVSPAGYVLLTSPVSSATATSSIRVQLGYYLGSDAAVVFPNEGFTWAPMSAPSYGATVTDAHFTGSLSLASIPNLYGASPGGDLGLGVRCSGDGGATWVYGDLRHETEPLSGIIFGSADALSSPLSVFVSGFSVTDCAVVGHTSGAITQTTTETASLGAQVAIAGLTSLTTGQDASSSITDIVVRRGYGTAGTQPSDASWAANWVSAAAASGYGTGHANYRANYDLFTANLSIADAGTYGVAFQVSGDAGGTWTTCGASGTVTTPSVFATITSGSPPCLLISEYVEGTSNNKAIEIWNCGSTAVDLANYEICLVANSATTCSSTMAAWSSGYSPAQPQTLGAGATRTYCHNSWAIGGTCDVKNSTTSSVMNFNGDDRLALRLVSGSTVVDAWGELAVNPGSAIWANRTYSRTDCSRFLGSASWLVGTFFTQVGTGADVVTNLGTAPTCSTGP